MPSLADVRQTYRKFELLESSAAADPFDQFDQWFQQAQHSEVPEPTAMVLATADAHGRPSARTVLLKGYDRRGFVFFTNYESRKGQELAANPYASLLFFWEALERQVRIEGRVARLPAAESDTYYDSRPLGSRIGAWASPQSRPISHEALASRVQALAAELGEHPARPPFWGGLCLHAERFEFWQGRPSRLHDRLLYLPAGGAGKMPQESGGGAWTITRIAP